MATVEDVQAEETAVRILGVEVDLAHPEELVRRVAGWAPEAPPRRVMYVNPHVLNQAAEHPALLEALRAADLVYCDGYGVQLAARMLALPVPHRMTGADWIWALAGLCEAHGLSLYLLGSEPGVAAEAAAHLRRWYPRLEIAGTHHGFAAQDGSAVAEINACRPGIVLAGMGTPAQEVWVHEHADALDAGVVWTVGALFDHVSGRIPRAPAWLADNGLEWTFRLALEPRRLWRRYLFGNPAFLRRVLAQRRG